MNRSARSTRLLHSLSVEELIALDAKILDRINDKRHVLRAKLALIETHVGEGSLVRRRGVKKGTKLAPKYRGPNGETWSGRGLHPKWLTALTDRGQNPDKYRLS